MPKESKKKDREYMAILDRPIEELKKPMGQSVDFGAECLPEMCISVYISVDRYVGTTIGIFLLTDCYT